MRVLSLVFLLIPLLVFSQRSKYAGRNMSETLPERFMVNIDSIRSDIIDRIPEQYKEDKKSARRNLRFADHAAFRAYELLTEGYVYSDWPDFENYLNKVLRRILPPELSNDGQIQAFVVRNGSFNAFMTPSGKFFIHIGLMPHLYDESALAAIMCHEVAHYYAHHSFQKYHNYETGEYGGGEPGEWRSARHSVRMELEADSLAMLWHARAGYSSTGMLDLLQTLQRIETRWDLKQRKAEVKESKWNKPTHPGAKERQDAFMEFYKSHNTGGASYLVDEQLFTELVAACKPEILKVLLSVTHYRTCVESAFSFHLFEPDNPVYVWYLMEGIRRMAYLDDSNWERKFITDRYYTKQAGVGKLNRVKTEKHLFDTFDMDVMCLAPKTLAQIQARFYWEGEPRFTTYEEAFLFFAELGSALSCHECTLSEALALKAHKKVRDRLLKQYINGPALHKVFATDLLNGQVRKKLIPRRLIVFSDFDGFVRQGKEDIPIRLAGTQGEAQMSRLADALRGIYKGSEVLFMPEQKNTSLSKYHMLVELRSLARYPTFAKGERTQLHLLDPKYLKLFKEYNVNEIVFVWCLYGEYRKKEKSTDAYEDILEMDYESVFNQTNRTRFIEVMVSTVREIDNSPMKYRHYGGEKHLKFKGEGLSQIVFEIKRAVNNMDSDIRAVQIYMF